MSKLPSVLLGCLLMLSLLTLSCQGKPPETKAPGMPEAAPAAPPASTAPQEETESLAPKPASFLLSDLRITPSEVMSGSSVAIEVTVTNTGELSGSHAVALRIDGVVEASEQVTLDGGASKKKTFTTVKYTARTYSVAVGELSGQFTVKEPPKAATPPEPEVQVLKIKWLGHSAFLITADDGTRIVTDPYTRGSGVNYGEVGEAADIVTVSHEHFDHNNVSAVSGKPQVVRTSAVVKGIEFSSVPTFHDSSQGSQRGANTVMSFEVSGFRISHLGDLGHPLDDRQVAEIGRVDILLIPVGGTYTIDAATATQIAERLKPKVIIPMHYKTDKLDFPIAGVDGFLQGKSNVTRLDSSEIEFKTGQLPASAQIIVLLPAR